MNKNKTKSLGFILLFTAVITSLFNNESQSLIIKFVERYFSPDQHLQPPGIEFVKFQFLKLKVFLFFSGILLSTPLGGFLWSKLQKTWSSLIDTSRLSKFLFGNSYLSQKIEKNIFYFTTFLSLSLYLYVLSLGEPAYEGLLETISAFGFFVAGFFAFYSFFLVRKLPLNHSIEKYLKPFLLCLGILLIGLGGEEVSWGQRIFGWQAFGVFETYNYQKETTIHNFFNPLFIYIYPAIGISFFVFLLLFWFFPAKNCHEFIHRVAPPPSFIILTFVMAGLSFRGHSEAYEVLLSLFFIVYTFRMIWFIRKECIPQ